MSNVDKIARCSKSAKVEIELASKHLEGGAYNIQYVLTMLEEAKRQLDAITDIYCKVES